MSAGRDDEVGEKSETLRLGDHGAKFSTGRIRNVKATKNLETYHWSRQANGEVPHFAPRTIPSPHQTLGQS